MKRPPPRSTLTYTLFALHHALPISGDASKAQETDPATELAIVIEQARAAAAGEVAPDAALKRRFIQALARMICDAMHPESGDPAFQAIVLRHRRSEEHTSELQSLMRISYAVFCLQKKKK